ncbi:MAG TPA: Gmad2 immunoglobulin-like domain-containing protein [Candidatus Limnocylindrales bacterium]
MNVHRILGAPLRSVTLVVLVALSSAPIACAPSTGIAGPIATPPPTSQPSVVQSPDATAPPSGSPAPSVPNGPSTGPSATAAPPSPPPGASGTTVVRAYFVRPDERPGAFPWDLTPTLRTVPETRGVARAAMTQLLGGPGSDGGQTLIPSAVTLLDVSIDDGVATVDVSAGFAAGGTTASQIGRAAQVVYTLTQFSNVKGVLIQVEGEPVAVPDASGRTHTDPVRRADYRDLLPAIFVDRPAYGAAIGNPARVAGLANVFEATFRVRLIDAGGRTLVDRQVMASCGTGCWGTFDVTVAYAIEKAQWGTLRVYDRSAQAGSPENVVEYRVWLTPA